MTQITKNGVSGKTLEFEINYINYYKFSQNKNLQK